MEIRRTNSTDLNKILALYEAARVFMEENNNPDQWGKLYPSKQLLERDIEYDKSYVCVDDCQILGTFYFEVGIEPTYLKIFDGGWLNDLPYGVVHRITTVREKRGVASFCLDWCLKQCGNVRIDTHRNNIPMIKLLEKNGYVQCGTIYLENGDERIAFQKIGILTHP